MTFLDALQIWEINHPNKDFFDDIKIDTKELIEKDKLVAYLMLEFGDMETIDRYTDMFHLRVKIFFDIHRWNIDKLAETLNYDYDPLTNSKWQRHRDTVDTKKTEHTKGISDDRTTEHTKEITDNTETTHTKGVTDDRYYSENGNHSITKVRYVSAFNENESPEQIGTDANGNPIYKFNDTEKERDTEQKNYSLSGDSTDKIDETYSETVGDTLNEHLTETMRESIGESFDEDMNDVVLEDIVYTGNSGVAYQDYIDKQRNIAQFNIYKWIARHFCKELLIQLW